MIQVLMNNVQEWYIKGIDKNQPIYYIDKPQFEFPKKEVDRGGKKILIAEKKPIWKPIVIEAPLELNSDIRYWVNHKQKMSLEAFRINNGNIIIHWFLQNARVVKANIRKGRRINNNVNFLTVEFEWSRYIK